MGGVFITTQHFNFRRVRQINTTDSAYPTRAFTQTPPAANLGNNASQTTAPGVIDLTNGGLICPNSAEIIFFGVGSATNTFNARIIAWKKLIEQGNEATAAWLPVPIGGDLLCTLGTQAGVAGSLIDNTNLFAATLTITGTTSNAGVHINVVSPANNTCGRVTVDLEGYRYLEVIFNTNASATSCNALVSMI